MKIVNWLFAVLFALFAAVQYNDPDPLQWTVLYAGVAVFYALAALGRQRYRWAVWFWLAWALLWAGFLAPEFWNWLQMGAPSIVGSMKAGTPYVEFTREFLGLSVAAAGCVWLLFGKQSQGKPG
ncbi:MAG: transmembrane 220 family protein [Saprospirales bacterium]|jgi:hypothetical protein|nr:transmembrane 220 family protein [Saprospirales bacterium]